MQPLAGLANRHQAHGQTRDRKLGTDYCVDAANAGAVLSTPTHTGWCSVLTRRCSAQLISKEAPGEASLAYGPPWSHAASKRLSDTEVPEAGTKHCIGGLLAGKNNGGGRSGKLQISGTECLSSDIIEESQPRHTVKSCGYRGGFLPFKSLLPTGAESQTLVL